MQQDEFYQSLGGSMMILFNNDFAELYSVVIRYVDLNFR